MCLVLLIQVLCRLTKVIKILYKDRTVIVDKGSIALIEAKRRALVDEDESEKNIREEYDYLMDDDYEIIDFMTNSMDWDDIEPFVLKIIFKVQQTNKQLWHGHSAELEDAEE